MIRTDFISEEKLVDLLKNHDVKGFAYLYDHYSAALQGVLFHMLHSNDLAEDILQETFIKIWKNIGSYDSKKGSLFTWILNIARNTAIDKVRSLDYKHHHQVYTVDTQLYRIDSHRHATPEVDSIGLRTCIAQLKVEHQQVIEYLYFKGYTHMELAEELGIPLGTVKTRIKAAVQHLRKMLHTDVMALAS